MKNSIVTLLCVFLFQSYSQDLEVPVFFTSSNANEGYVSDVNEVLKSGEALSFEVNKNGSISANLSCTDISNLMMLIPVKKYKNVTISSQFGSEREKIWKYLKEKENKNATKEDYIVVKFLDYYKSIYSIGKDQSANDGLCAMLETNYGLHIRFGKGKNSHEITLRDDKEKSEVISQVYSDDPMVKIEPRRYITIYEKGLEESEPIWCLSSVDEVDLMKRKYPKEDYPVTYSTKFRSNQKYSVLDEEAMIEIKFDQEMLASNLNFYGNISLSATLDDVPIPVEPYSVIGRDRTSYGVKNQPIMEISSHFLNFFIEAENALSIFHRLPNVYDEEAKEVIKLNYVKRDLEEITEMLYVLQNDFLFSDEKVPSSLFRKAKEISGADTLAVLKDLNEEIDRGAEFLSMSRLEVEDLVDKEDSLVRINGLRFLNELRNQYREYNEYNYKTLEDIKYYAFKALDAIKKNSSGNVWKGLDTLSRLQIDPRTLKANLSMVLNLLKGEEITQEMISDTKAVGNAIEEDLRSFMHNVDLVIQYMDYFGKSGEESIKAFLHLAQVTEIRYEAARKSLKENYSALKELIEASEINNIFSPSDERAKYQTSITRIEKDLEDFSSRTRKFLERENKPENLNAKEDNVYNRLFPTKDNERKSLIEEKNLDQEINELLKNQYEFFQKRIAEKAGRIIFNRMLYATIDLEKANAKEGQYLEVCVVWRDISETDTTDNDKQELLAAKFQIRKTGWHLNVTESAFLVQRINEDLVTTDVSPSNFKPTAGISLLWSYHNDFRGKNFGGRFCRWLEPSFGLNVSYADFSTAKDYEITLGPVVGLWRNRVFLTSGYNFNVGGQSPFYVGIGLSFSNIANNIKTKD